MTLAATRIRRTGTAPAAPANPFTQVTPPANVSASSITVTFPAAVTAGRPVYVLWVGQFTRSVSSMSGLGATWSRVVRVPGTSFDLSCEIWKGTGATGGTTVTANHNAASARFFAIGVELKAGYAGTARTTASAGPTTSTSPVIPSIVPVVGEVVLGLTACDTSGFTYGAPTDSPAAWSDLTGVDSGNTKARWGYRVATSTAAHQRAYAATGTLEWVGASTVIA